MEVLKKEELKYGKEDALVEVQEEVNVVEEVERGCTYSTFYFYLFRRECLLLFYLFVEGDKWIRCKKVRCASLSRIKDAASLRRTVLLQSRS